MVASIRPIVSRSRGSVGLPAGSTVHPSYNRKGAKGHPDTVSSMQSPWPSAAPASPQVALGHWKELLLPSPPHRYASSRLYSCHEDASRSGMHQSNPYVVGLIWWRHGRYMLRFQLAGGLGLMHSGSNVGLSGSFLAITKQSKFHID
jgi:hypothetical protein